MSPVDARLGSCRLSYPDHWIEVPLDPRHLDHRDPDALLRAVADRFDQPGVPSSDLPPPDAADGVDRGQVRGQTGDGREVHQVDDLDGVPGNADDVQDHELRVLVGLVVAVLSEDSARGALLGAHRYEHDPELGHIHAHLTLWVVERQRPDSLEAELARLVDLARQADGAMEVPEVDEVSLPHAGRALRVRFLEAERLAEPTRSEPDGGPGRTAGSEDDDDIPDIHAVLLDTVTYLVPVPESSRCVWLRFWTPHLAVTERLVEEFDGIAHSLEVDPGTTEPR